MHYLSAKEVVAATAFPHFINEGVRLHQTELAQGSGMATASRLAQGAPLSGLSALRRGLAGARSFGAGRNPASRTFVDSLKQFRH
jgi:hypothetical protein